MEKPPQPQQQGQDPFAVKVADKPAKTIASLLVDERFKGEVAKALPKDIAVDLMLRVALTTVRGKPEIANCSIESFQLAILKCAQYGLLPDGRHAHLIPFKKKGWNGAPDTYELQLIFDYKGLAALVLRSGLVANIHCDVVYEDDYFQVEYGSNEILVHRPNLKSRNRTRDNIYCAYSSVKMRDGTTSFDVMPIDDVYDIRDRSQGYIAAKKYDKPSVWDTDFNAMAAKTVFRKHSKLLPLSAETKTAINDDDDTLERIAEERRFERAKQVNANDPLAPDFAAITDRQEQPVDFQNAPPPPGELQPVETKQQTRDKEATQQQQTPPPPQQPAAGKPASSKPSKRQQLSGDITEKAKQDGITVEQVVAEIVRQGWVQGGVQFTALTSDHLEEILTNWDTIVAKIKG